MKTLSSNTATAVDAPNVAPILLVQIAFTSPAALTLYLCSRPFDDRNTYDGDCYDPLIASWSPIRQGAVDPVNWFTNAGDMTLNILNNIPVGGYPSFSGLLAHYDWAFAEVTVMQAHEDALAADDHVALFAGFVENPDGMDRAVVTLTVSGRELAYSEKWPVAFVTTDDYPNADPDDVGKMLPQCWGPCKRAPFMAVAAGWITTLAEDIGADTLGAVEFTDVGGLPAAGSIQIGDEIISYSAKSEEDSTLTLDQRGYDDTVPSVHNRGENVAEIRTEYCYILDHAVHAINAVYVAGVLVSDEDTFTAYTGQAGDQHADYGAKACIAFSALPQIVRQVNQEIEDTITISEAPHNHTVSGGSYTQDTGGTLVDYTPTYNAVLYPSNGIDGDGTTQCRIEASPTAERHWVKYRFQGTPTETLSQVGVLLRYKTDTYANGYISVNGGVKQSFGAAETVTEQWFYFTPAQGADWTVDVEIEGAIRHQVYVPWQGYDYVYPDVYVYEVWEVRYYYTTGSTTSSSLAGVTKTGTVALYGNSVADNVIGGDVCADIDGRRDDGAGTYTGTAGAAIERPDHIFRHCIQGVLGLSDTLVDATSYAASGAQYAADGHTLGVCLTEPPHLPSFFSAMARQCRSMQCWEGGVHVLKYVDTGAGAVKTLSGHRIARTGISLGLTLRAEIKNSITATYGKHWSGYTDDEAMRASVAATESAAVAASVAAYGNIYLNIALDYVPDEATAQDVVDWLAAWRVESRLVLDIVCDLSALDVERGDMIGMDLDDAQYSLDEASFDHYGEWAHQGDWDFVQDAWTKSLVPSELRRALLGFVTETDQVFLVVDKEYLSDYRQRIAAVLIA